MIFPQIETIDKQLTQHGKLASLVAHPLKRAVYTEQVYCIIQISKYYYTQEQNLSKSGVNSNSLTDTRWCDKTLKRKSSCG